MKSKHVIRIAAPVEPVVKKLLAADVYLSFVPGYTAFESADPNWPEKGSSMVFRVGPIYFRDTVVEHRENFLACHEETMPRGWYVDDTEMLFEEENGATKLTLTRDVTSPLLLLRIFMALAYPFTRNRTATAVEKRMNAIMGVSA